PPRRPAAADRLPRAGALGAGAWPLQPEPAPPSPVAPPLPPRPHRAPPPPPPQVAAENGQWHAEPEPPAPPARPHRAPPPQPQVAAENGQWHAEPEPPPPARPNRVVHPLAAPAAELTPTPPPRPPPPRAPGDGVGEVPGYPRRAARQGPAAVRQPHPTNGAADPQSAPPADQNLAEMAQRLEAALRRPPARPEARSEPKARPAPQPAP